MKAQFKVKTASVTFRMRADLKEAMKAIQARRMEAEGSYINLGRIFSEAVRLLLAQEGLEIHSEQTPPPPQRVQSAKSIKAARRSAA